MSDDLALLETVDFFPPIVDDPFVFGQISATNALSDIYVMGGKPLLALNLVAFPLNCLPLSILSLILKGGISKVEEAGALVVGGHSIEDEEPKYGLSITGVINPKDLIMMDKAKPSDVFVLTKPLGIGIITTAHKGGIADPDILKEAIDSMITLNRIPSEVMVEVGVSSATDITGFGLLGHLKELLSLSRVGAEIFVDSIPIFEKALDYASMGLAPVGTKKNKEFVHDKLVIKEKISAELLDILHDPQTSGGVLAAVPQEKADLFIKELKEKGVKKASVIGRIVEDKEGKIKIFKRGL